MVNRTWNQSVGIERYKGLIQQSRDVLPRGNTRDGAGQDVVEHQGGNADLGQGPAQGFFHNAEDARSWSTMAAARHQLMKVSITELATTIRTRLELKMGWVVPVVDDIGRN